MKIPNCIKIALPLLFSLNLSAQKIALDTLPYALEYHQERLDLFKKETAVMGKTVFLGDSQIEFGNWKNHLNDTTIINRGIGGDNTYGVLARLTDVLILKPNQIILEIGINDIAKNIPDTLIYKNILEIVKKIKTHSPQTKIFVTSLFPTNDAVAKEYPNAFNKNSCVENVNNLLKTASVKGDFTFLDLHSLLKNFDGKLNEQFARADGLHLNSEGYKLWVDVLKKHYVNPKTSIKLSPNESLLAAALHGNVQEIKKAMAKGAEVNCKDKDGNTPLNMVAKLSYYNLVKYFVEKGAEINTSNNDHITPLHYGVEYNNVKIVQLLLEKGANIDARDGINETPLHWAGWTGNIEVARLLLKYGANPYTPNNTDVTPLFNANRQEHWQLERIFKKSKYQKKFIQ
jgi:lysophospholipase L1-like esterase